VSSISSLQTLSYITLATCGRIAHSNSCLSMMCCFLLCLILLYLTKILFLPSLECIESKIYMLLVLFFIPVLSVDQGFGKDVPLRLGVI